MNWVETFKQLKAGLSPDKAVRDEVEQALSRYPFFAMARMMAAKIATRENDPRAHGLRFLASLYAPHRQYYAFFMGDRVRPNVAPPPRIGGQEPQPPKQAAPSKEEPPASSDEPGPAGPMPFSPEYLPKLQGRLKARSHLYKGFSERIRRAIRLPPVALPPLSQEVAPPAERPVPETPSQEVTPYTEHPAPETLSQDTPPLESPLITSEEPLESGLSVGTSDATPADASLDMPLMATPHEAPPPAKLSPSLLVLQFELEDKPPTAPRKPSPEPPPATSEPPSPPQPPSHTTPPTAATETDRPPQPAESTATQPPPSEEPVSAFLKDYVPLETPEAPVALVSPSPSEEAIGQASAASISPPDALPDTTRSTSVPTAGSAPLPEPLSALSKDYVPLEDPEAPVSTFKAQGSTLQTEAPSPPLSQEVLKSESPIRLVILPEFNPEGSIHLPIPEPSEEGPMPTVSQETTAGASEAFVSSASTVSEDAPAPSARSLSPAWQSFLSEIEKPLVQAAQEALPHAPQTIEKLRQTFIRYLLEARKERRLPQEPPPPSSAIEEVLRLLETFRPREPEREVSAPTLISVPESEASPAPPAIYTETMARLCWSQGDLPLAVEIYEKLKARHPEKAAYYQSQIERIRRGERP